MPRVTNDDVKLEKPGHVPDTRRLAPRSFVRVEVGPLGESLFAFHRPWLYSPSGDFAIMVEKGSMVPELRLVRRQKAMTLQCLWRMVLFGWFGCIGLADESFSSDRCEGRQQVVASAQGGSRCGVVWSELRTALSRKRSDVTNQENGCCLHRDTCLMQLLLNRPPHVHNSNRGYESRRSAHP